LLLLHSLFHADGVDDKLKVFQDFRLLALDKALDRRIVWPTERTCMDLAGLNLLMDSATN